MPDRSHGAHTPRTFLTRVEFANRVDSELVPFDNDVYTICYLHLDQLRRFNRIHGIEAGDEVLQSIARMLNTIIVDGLLARYAGDGFIYVIQSELAKTSAERINNLLPTLDEVGGLKAKVGAISCRRPMGAADCVERARFACETIAEDDDAFYRLFDESLQLVFDKRNYVVDHLNEAIAAGEIEAWCQPIVRVLTGQVCEIEVLARWNSARYGMLRPDEFIPQLEQHGLIYKLDLEVFRLACKQWNDAQHFGINLPFGVNLSRLDFELCDIYTNLHEIMGRYGVPIDQVHIEVTESTEAHNYAQLIENVNRFRKDGFSIYMDDFGTGYSSLGTMADFDFDVIKIDKSFLDRIETNERARAVLADTVSMVKRLGIQTLCEGVETQEQFKFLLAIGCEKAQGYLFSRPLSYDQVIATLDKRVSAGEKTGDDEYLDAVGQVNLLDGTSVAMHGIEAATVYGRNPIALLERCEGRVRLLTCNLAHEKLLARMGFKTFDEFIAYTTQGSGKVAARALEAMKLAAKTGREQCFDFIIHNTFCSVITKFVAKTDNREAFLHIVTSIDNAPQITENTLLTAILANPDRKYFWKDNQRRFLGANQAFLDYYDFPGLGTILGKTDEDMGWHVDNDPFRNDELRVLRGETIFDADGVCMQRGKYRRIRANKRPLYSNGAIIGLVGYFEDLGPYEPDANGDEQEQLAP